MGTKQVRDYIATDQEDGAGACVFWSLSGSADAVMLEHELQDLGVPGRLVPTTPTPRTALHRALRRIAERRVLVRPLNEPGAYVVVNEDVGNDGAEYEVKWTVRLGPIGTPKFSDGAPCNVRTQIEVEFERQMGELSQGDVSAWLPRVVEFCDGVPLRSTGGFYYLPPHGLELWRSIANALQLASVHVLYELPTMRTEKATKAILDSLESEAARAAAAMAGELADDVIGEKARETRLGKVADMEAKLGRYESMLGEKLDSFRGKLGQLRAALAADAIEQNADELKQMFAGF